MDRDLHPWNSPPPSQPPNVESKTGWCPVPSKNGTITGQNGQACFWFSNGCAVGCDECDGSSRGPIPGVGTGPNTSPPTGIGRNKVGPGVVCKKSNGVEPTMCDPEHRTVNQGAACGGPSDYYYYSPWRARAHRPPSPDCLLPLTRFLRAAAGAAPVLDACGVAGGHRPPDGAFGGIYVNTSHAKLGDAGSKVLPVTPSGTTWAAVSAATVGVL